MLRHNRNTLLELLAARDFEGITLKISDDGAGFDTQGDFPGHLGLESMRERAFRLAGTLEISGGPREGTRVPAGCPR